MTSSQTYYFFLELIPRALQTPSIYVNTYNYDLFVDVGGDDDSFFFHVFQVVEALLVLLHFEVVFNYYGENVPSSHSLLNVGLNYKKNTSYKSLKYYFIICSGFESANSLRLMNFSINYFLYVKFDIFAYLSALVDFDMCLIDSFNAAIALS